MLLILPDETPDEAAVRIDELLAKNSYAPLICISCLEPIPFGAAMIPTIHGPYHGAPLKCVEGRPDKND